MKLGIDGRVALVGAASRGIGRAVAEELAREGARVIICARGDAALQEARAGIREQTGATVEAVAADLATAAGVATVLQAAHAQFGRVDILVTNTGGPPSGPFEQHEWSAWQGAVDLLLRSAVELTRGVLPGMRERRWGRILAITSIAVKQPVEGLILSNSIRAAVTGFMRTLANEAAADGITVNTLLPGYTRTDRVEQLNAETARREHLAEEDVRSRLERQVPTRRMGEPAELAGLAAFLASERAGYITGQAIAVDGGWIRGLL